MWSFFLSLFSCIQTEYRKIRTRKISVFGHFWRSESAMSLLALWYKVGEDTWYIDKKDVLQTLEPIFKSFKPIRKVWFSIYYCLIKIPNQHFNVGSTLFQLCGSMLKRLWSDVENATKSEIGFSMMRIVNTTWKSDVETKMEQSWYNIISALSQHGLDVI